MCGCVPQTAELYQHIIEVLHGNVKVFRRTGPGFADVNIQFVYSGTAAPFIAEPSDLTREKLGDLVEMAIREP